MKFFYLGACALFVFLAGCESADQEKEELDLIVQLEDQEESPWDKQSERGAFDESQEMPLLEKDEVSR